MPQILPLLKGIADKYIEDEEVMDGVWLLLKQTAASLVEKNLQVVMQVIEFISNCYAVRPYSSALELAHHILVLLSAQNNPEMKNVLVVLFARMSVRTVEALQSIQNPSDLSDLVGTFFQQMAQMVKKHMDFFGPQGIDAKSLAQTAAFCLNLPELRAVKYTSQFLYHLISCCPESPYLMQVVRDGGGGEFIFRQTLTCIANEKGRSYADNYAEILFAMSKRLFEDLKRYLEAFAKEDGFPNSNVTREEKTQFAQSLLRERTNKRKVIEIVNEFSLNCVGAKG